MAARRRKERTYPELVEDSGRAKLVVLAGEIGERLSEETPGAVAHTCSSILGPQVEGPFWLVPQPGRLHLRCWIVRATVERTAPPRRVQKFFLISAGRHVLRGSL